LRNLEALDKNASYSAFRSMRMKLAWLANTRPDCLFEISQLSQVTEDRFKTDKQRLIRQLNKAVKYAVDNHKSKRVVRSAMAGEVIAFSDLFDVAAALSSELSVLYGKNIPVQLLTDSKSLFDVISKGSRTSGKRMMLDIAATREGFRNKVISDIGFVRSSNNLADGLTKAMSQAALQQVISTGRINVTPEQWIIRD